MSSTNVASKTARRTRALLPPTRRVWLNGLRTIHGILRQPIVALALANNEPGHQRRLGEVSGRSQPIPTPGMGVSSSTRRPTGRSSSPALAAMSSTVVGVRPSVPLHRGHWSGEIDHLAGPGDVDRSPVGLA